MTKINFSVDINGINIFSNIKLEGQQLYFFEKGSEREKQAWVKSYLERVMKISNIEIEQVK